MSLINAHTFYIIICKRYQVNVSCSNKIDTALIEAMSIILYLLVII